MPELIKAKEPFKFSTRLNLTELTGLRAATLTQLLDLISRVPGSSIYHHTHRFLQQHQFFSPEPPNDFAYWVTEVLGETELGEELSSIDTIQYFSIAELRKKIVTTIELYLRSNYLAKLKFARSGEEFHFLKSVSFVLSTSYIANDLNEFADIIGKITIDSIYFHIFEARLRLEKGENDFSNWIKCCIGDEKLANEILRMDPYTYTLENLRERIISIIKGRI